MGRTFSFSAPTPAIAAHPSCAWTRAPATWKPGAISNFPIARAFYYGSAKLSSDGKSYAFTFQRDLSTLYLVKGIK